MNTVELLCTAEGESEAGHDFVENQDSAPSCAVIARSAFEVAGRGRNAAGIADDGLDDDAGNLTLIPREGLLDRGDVVIRQGEGVLNGFLWNAGGTGNAEGGDAGAGLDQQGVGVTVVATLEFDEVFAAGEGAGESDGRHGGFGAGADEAHLLDRWKGLADQLGEVGFGGGGGAEADASGCGLLHGFHHLRGGVAENHGAPGAEVVEVAIAVGIPEIGAFGADNEWRLAADSTKGTHRRVDAAGEQSFRPLLELAGKMHGSRRWSHRYPV